jgi:hypothetical protein
VYFVLGDDLVKIGTTSKGIKKRLRGIKEEVPYKLSLMGTIPGDVIVERALHKYFRKRTKAVSREWFRMDNDTYLLIYGIIQFFSNPQTTREELESVPLSRDLLDLLELLEIDNRVKDRREANHANVI